MFSYIFLMPLGNVFIHTKKLALHEIGAIVASNIMIGNVSFLEDCVLGRIFYYMFMPIFNFCPFLCVVDGKVLESKDFKDIIDYEIIARQDFIRLRDDKTRNFLVWDKGVSVVFISSFYDIYEVANR